MAGVPPVKINKRWVLYLLGIVPNLAILIFVLYVAASQGAPAHTYFALLAIWALATAVGAWIGIRFAKSLGFYA